MFTTSKEVLLRWPDTYFQGLLGSGRWAPEENGTCAYAINNTDSRRVLYR